MTAPSSVCIKENNPVCLYRQNHSTKTRSKAILAPQFSDHRGAEGQAGQAQLTSVAGMVALSNRRSASEVVAIVSLKRYDMIGKHITPHSEPLSDANTERVRLYSPSA